MYVNAFAERNGDEPLRRLPNLTRRATRCPNLRWSLLARMPALRLVAGLLTWGVALGTLIDTARQQNGKLGWADLLLIGFLAASGFAFVIWSQYE